MQQDERLVTVFSQPNCLPCKRVVSKLKAAGIHVDVIDVTRDELAYTYLSDTLGVASTPVVEANGFEPIVGYQPDRLADLIASIKIESALDEIHDHVGEEDAEE